MDDRKRDSADDDVSAAALSRPETAAPQPLVLGTGESSGTARALAAALERQAEDAAVARAHLRELIRAVDGLAQTQEYLGVALRGERRRNRLLLACAVLVPLVLGAAAWGLWQEFRASDRRIDEVRTALDAELRTVRERHAGERESALRAAYEERVARLEEDASTARTDLDAARRTLGDERTDRAAREKDATERLARAERELAELAAYRAEVRTLRDALGAERSRSDTLTKALAERPPSPPPPPSESAATATEATAPAANGAPRSPAVPPVSPSRRAASTAPEDLARIRDLLNGLLDGATGAARYRVETLGGVSGYELHDLRVVGRDTDGEVLRTIEASRAEIVVAASGAVRWRFRDGHLVVGERRAPFFDGSYALSLESRFEAWRDSGLTCVRLP